MLNVAKHLQVGSRPLNWRFFAALRMTARCDTTRKIKRGPRCPSPRAAHGAIGATLLWLCSGCVTSGGLHPAPKTDEVELRTAALECLKAGIQYRHNPAVRVEAIEAMESANSNLVLPWIRSALLDEQPAVRFAACLAIGNARDAVAANAIDKCLSDPNASVQVAALYARHRLGKTNLTGKLPTYLLKNEDPMVRRNAAFVLGLLGEPGAIPVLARAVKDDAEPGVRHHALEAMARLGNPEARQELTFATNSGVGSEEVMAVQALAGSGDRRFVETYRYKLNTATHLETKLVAANALGALGIDEGYDLAFQSLAVVPSRTTSDANDPPAAQTLRIRLLAIAALGAIGRSDALGPLGRQLHGDPDPRVQVAAARAILDITSRGGPGAGAPVARAQTSRATATP